LPAARPRGRRVAGAGMGAATSERWPRRPCRVSLTLCLDRTDGAGQFYVQHQFEGTSWERDGDWSFHGGALAGSSHLDLPPVLRWFTADIGVHHVHHLSARIPSYRLGEVLRDHPELRGVNRLTLWRSFSCFRLALWDEEGKRLISFREARRPVRGRRAFAPAAHTADGSFAARIASTAGA
ncbi:MAG TPA: fatty acid desaturase, partial [Geminicoccaceae bacterium]|nr:fatty acid desaturase [Geminicoccaceae bacterium]